MLLGLSGTASVKHAEPFTPKHGDIVDIHCNLPYGDDYKPLLFRGRVVRLDVDGAGLAFIDPDMNALHSLHQYALHRQNDRSAAENRQDDVDDAEDAELSDTVRLRLLAACRDRIQSHAEPLIDTFLRHAVMRLNHAAETLDGLPRRNACYDGVALLTHEGDAIKRVFVECYAQQQARSPAATLDLLKDAATGFAKTRLSLIEEEAFEEWLALSDMVHKTETACQSQLVPLTQRLGALFKTSVDKKSNPYGPAAWAKVFQDTLRNFGFAPATLPILYSIFRDSLIVQLDELYGNLNDYLIKNHVLADLRHQFVITPSKPVPAPSGVLPSVAADLAAPGVPGAPAAAPNPDLTADAGAHEIARLDSARSNHDWYNLVRNLEAVQKQIARRPEGRLSFPAPPPPASEPATEFYTPQELERALPGLRASAVAEAIADPQSLRPQLLAALSSGSSMTARQLPERENRILDMAGKLLDSILNDGLLAENVKPWLQQLTIPVARTALLDESVFFDKTHLIRQVINAVAQLEFYGADDEEGGRVNRKIDSLLAEICLAETLSPELLDRVLKEFNSLIHIQNKAYAENLGDVLAACEAEPAGCLDTPDDAIPENIEMLAPWKKRIRRLRLGDSLLLDADCRPRRVKLAWISDEYRQFVFVNVKGLKERTLTDDALAEGLRSGSLKVLDDGGEPLLDRAQYSMLQKMHSHLLHETTHDQLTGLVNRREFERRLSEALLSARESKLHHVICYIDLTQFNVVNNTFGYDGGDRLLREIADLFKEQLNANATLARIGGDEFAILLESCTVEEALAMTACYREAIQDYRFAVGDKSLSVAFSAGLVAISDESDGMIALLQSAEACCHIARGKGSNYVQVFSAENAELLHHMEALKWVTRIDEALDRENFDLRHQPVAGIERDGLSIHHSEVLLGLLNDKGELISPAEFVIAAERFRRMAAVDRWVIEHAFRWMVENGERLHEIGGLAINLSGSSLNEEGFADFIMEQAARLAVPMDRVCFEITETAGIANLSNASAFILAVKKTGCMFALDDFGSGLSSYAYLKNLPVDFLKIDGMFIKNMDRNPCDYAVVKSITEIGHFMGKKIIAEFVESIEILDMLREIGVDFAQGYAVAKPQSLRMLTG